MDVSADDNCLRKYLLFLVGINILECIICQVNGRYLMCGGRLRLQITIFLGRRQRYQGCKRIFEFLVRCLRWNNDRVEINGRSLILSLSFNWPSKVKWTGRLLKTLFGLQMLPTDMSIMIILMHRIMDSYICDNRWQFPNNWLEFSSIEKQFPTQRLMYKLTNFFQ